MADENDVPELTPAAQRTIDNYLKNLMRKVVIGGLVINGVVVAWLYNEIKTAAKTQAEIVARDMLEKDTKRIDFYETKLVKIVESAEADSKTTHDNSIRLEGRYAQLNTRFEAMSTNATNLQKEYELAQANLGDQDIMKKMLQSYKEGTGSLSNALANNDIFISKTANLIKSKMGTEIESAVATAKAQIHEEQTAMASLLTGKIETASSTLSEIQDKLGKTTATVTETQGKLDRELPSLRNDLNTKVSLGAPVRLVAPLVDGKPVLEMTNPAKAIFHTISGLAPEATVKSPGQRWNIEVDK